mmetsp:Transcript_27288/g.46370  ORF Transcript_27288/g.46370 Transcript_27288/m.46370 type:complete len:265 (-) Transcript_27288:1425-2219(-)
MHVQQQTYAQCAPSPPQGPRAGVGQVLRVRHAPANVHRGPERAGLGVRVGAGLLHGLRAGGARGQRHGHRHDGGAAGHGEGAPGGARRDAGLLQHAVSGRDDRVYWQGGGGERVGGLGHLQLRGEPEPRQAGRDPGLLRESAAWGRAVLFGRVLRPALAHCNPRGRRDARGVFGGRTLHGRLPPHLPQGGVFGSSGADARGDCGDGPGAEAAVRQREVLQHHVPLLQAPGPAGDAVRGLRASRVLQGHHNGPPLNVRAGRPPRV